MNKNYQKYSGGNKNIGFTLIELLVVILIIGILASAVVPQYERAVAKSRYVNLMAVTDALYKAQQVFYLANGYYARTVDQLDVDLPGAQVSSSGTTYRLNGVDYQINVDGGESVMGLSKKAPLYNYYLIHYRTGARMCRAYTEGIPHYVCQSFGGVPSSAGSQFYSFP